MARRIHIASLLRKCKINLFQAFRICRKCFSSLIRSYLSLDYKGSMNSDAWSIRDHVLFINFLNFRWSMRSLILSQRHELCPSNNKVYDSIVWRVLCCKVLRFLGSGGILKKIKLRTGNKLWYNNCMIIRLHTVYREEGSIFLKTGAVNSIVST